MGRQSAAIRVAAADNDVGSANVALDLRADDHPSPIDELERLLALHNYYVGSTPEELRLPLEGELLDELRDLLTRLGHPVAAGPEGVPASLRNWVATENLAARWWGDPTLDPFVLEQLRAAAAASDGPG